MNKLLIVVLVLATFLRLWKLDSVPQSASMDEASIGWNAYSVLKTGKDEYGQFPLLSQRGYDDWRRSTYLFLTVPFIALLDLQVVAIRLPAVILSILTVWATYHVALLLSRSKPAAILSALLLSISPWHVYISRLGHESNAYLSFFVFGVLFFLESRLVVAILFFVLSMISYYAGQVFVPLFGLGVLFIYRATLKKMLIPILISAPLLIPILWAIFSPSALVRFGATSTFNPDAHYQEVTKRRELRTRAIENNDIVGQILNSERLFPVQVFIESYRSHFKPIWLFTNSSGEPFKVPNMGLLYLWELPFIVIGIFTLLFNRDVDERVKKLIFLWFLLASLPASIATGAPHAMRSYAIIPTWQIFTAIGVIWVASKFKIYWLILPGILLLLSLRLLIPNYFFVFPSEQSDSFHYALSKAFPIVFSKEADVGKIIFSNSDNLYQSYMLYLYYRRFDPMEYQKIGGTISGGYTKTHKIGKYEFRPIDWNIEGPGLYVGNVSEFPVDVDGIEVANKAGKTVIKIVSRE